MDEAYAEILDAIGATDWDYYGDMLHCPCGYAVEDDGICPEGCRSPFLTAGLI